MTTRDGVDVVFIGGASRTGSTLLSLLLGSLPGHFAAGEMRYLWLRGSRPTSCAAAASRSARAPSGGR